MHTRAMPLAGDVSLAVLAAATHGYVGADIAALCREAAIAALRRVGGATRAWDDAALDTLCVSGRRFSPPAMQGITPTALREAFVDIPDVHWSGRRRAGTPAGAAGTGGIAASGAGPICSPRWACGHPAACCCMAGPAPAKTLLARALATQAQAGFIAVRGPELLTEWQGASERALREVFARARMAAPCILFFDEIDAIGGRRGGGDGATVERMVAQLLTEMDGITEPAERGGAGRHQTASIVSIRPCCGRAVSIWFWKCRRSIMPPAWPCCACTPAACAWIAKSILDAVAAGHGKLCRRRYRRPVPPGRAGGAGAGGTPASTQQISWFCLSTSKPHCTATWKAAHGRICNIAGIHRRRFSAGAVRRSARRAGPGADRRSRRRNGSPWPRAAAAATVRRRQKGALAAMKDLSVIQRRLEAACAAGPFLPADPASACCKAADIGRLMANAASGIAPALRGPGAQWQWDIVLRWQPEPILGRAPR